MSSALLLPASWLGQSSLTLFSGLYFTPIVWRGEVQTCVCVCHVIITSECLKTQRFLLPSLHPRVKSDLLRVPEIRFQNYYRDMT